MNDDNMRIEQLEDGTWQVVIRAPSEEVAVWVAGTCAKVIQRMVDAIRQGRDLPAIEWD